MPPYRLADRTFRTKGEAVEYVRAVLRTAPVGEPIVDPLIHALLDTHPNRAEKIAGGVAAIEIMINEYGARCFGIRRPTRELVAFSFRECFNPSTHIQNAKSALRFEIIDQINEFRDGRLLVCEITGATLVRETGRPDTVEVDHIPPATFNAMAEWWAEHRMGGWSVVEHHSEAQHRRLTQFDQRESWVNFHRRYAKLRLLSAAAHRNVTRPPEDDPDRKLA